MESTLLTRYYERGHKTMINCVNEGVVSEVRGDAKQCKEQWERPKRGDNTGGLNHSYCRRKELWCNRVERSKKGREAMVLERGWADTYSKKCVCHRHRHKENTVVVRAFCHADKAEAEHGGWCSWVSQCQVSFWHGHPPTFLNNRLSGERERASGCTHPIKTSN